MRSRNGRIACIAAERSAPEALGSTATFAHARAALRAGPDGGSLDKSNTKGVVGTIVAMSVCSAFDGRDLALNGFVALAECTLVSLSSGERLPDDH